MKIVAHSFAAKDIVAGDPVLDLVNTVTARDTAIPVDWLDSYERLLAWTGLAGAVDAASLARLRKLAAASPRRAAAALTRAQRFREALHLVFAALIRGDAISADALQEVEGAWKKALSRAQLSPLVDGVAPALDAGRSGLDLIVDELALKAIDLMREFPTERARICLGSQCGWLFIDTSKGGRRVWCDMATCGNAAKSRRHHERRRG